jgi:hypothetical protein
LRLQRIAYRGRAQRHAGNGPIAIPSRHGVVRVHRLVRAMKRTDAEMNDADSLRPVVGGTTHSGWQRRELCVVEALHSDTLSL